MKKTGNGVILLGVVLALLGIIFLVKPEAVTIFNLEVTNYVAGFLVNIAIGVLAMFAGIIVIVVGVRTWLSPKHR